jgi:TonB family protein
MSAVQSPLNVVPHGCLPRGFRLREFVIERVLGDGGFGVVYSALDLRLERRVAIKEYMPSALARRDADYSVQMCTSPQHRNAFQVGLKSFINEAKLLASFEHPALIKVHQFWEEKGTAYMVMPFYSAPTLRAWIRARREPLDELWLRGFLLAAMDGLEVLHAARCLHRDIAPDNILVLKDAAPLLLDFGAARRVIGDLTQALTVMVKPGYAPLEQYADTVTMKQGPWTDVYALAAVAHFMLTGQAPAPAVSRVLADEVVPLAERLRGRYSASLLAAIDAALAVRPEKRPQSIAALRALLAPERAREWAPTEPLARPTAPAPAMTPGTANAAAHVVAAAPNVAAPPPRQRATGARHVPALLACCGTLALTVYLADAVVAPAPPPATEVAAPAQRVEPIDVVLAPIARAEAAAEDAPPPESFTIAPARIAPEAPAARAAAKAKPAARSETPAPGRLELQLAATVTPIASAPEPTPRAAELAPLERAPEATSPGPVRPVIAALPPAPSPAPPPELRAISRPQPAFPLEAVREGVRSGRVLAQIAVNADGSVGGIEIVEATPRRVFDKEVRRALSGWRYEAPGQPRKALVEFVFKLEG